ncbi:DEAD/DEAH box helicase family protein [Plantactinospora sp. B5E13]|uniref:DEAD/DEAH box helicase family protein n=1 Tax=Plantactinospora sp. B5E13 TaxID=3153758 RepID=UPI00325EF7DD
MDLRQVRRLAERSGNFGFLAAQPLLLCYGAGAESLVYRDPVRSMTAARAFGEILAQDLVRRTNSRPRSGSFHHRIRALVASGVLVPHILAAFEQLRGIGQLTHEPPDGPDEPGAALDCLRACFTLGSWWHRATTGDRTPVSFVPPSPPPATEPGPDRTAADRRPGSPAAGLFESLRPAIEAARQEFDRRPPERIPTDRREELVNQLRRTSREPLAGPRLRDELDRHLAAAGWVVQSENRSNLAAALGVAVRRTDGTTGPTDYLLHVDGRLVGVVETAPEATGNVLRPGGYRPGLTAAQRPTVWRPGQPLPFGYLATGTGTASVNGLDPFPRTREVFSVHRPATLARWMRAADDDPRAPTLRARLRQLPPLPAYGLWPAQHAALEALERSLAEDRPRSLIHLAAGTGKTRVAVAASYRLLRYAGAHRVLHLVDRNNLGRQALARYAGYRSPDDGPSFSESYPVDRLSGATMLGSARVVISTVQRLYAALAGRELPDADHDDEAYDSYESDTPVEVGYHPNLPPETFDVIVVDDCDRAVYGQWRGVLEYFDAVVVGLTTAPVQQSFGFFQQNLVAEYTGQEAVADGVGLDFDTYRIRVPDGVPGGSVEAGPVVPRWEQHTRAERHHEVEDDFGYVGGQPGRVVPAAPEQLRLVLETFRDRLPSEIFPGRTQVPKTLILARDAGHAEEVVTLVRDVFATTAGTGDRATTAAGDRAATSAASGIAAAGEPFAVAITYGTRWSAGDPDELLRAFRDTPYPRIAVTDDLIATGIDVPALECVVLLRPVRNAGHLARLTGRAARTVPPAEFRAITGDAPVKDRFVVVDAVGVTDAALAEAVPLHRCTERQLPLPELIGRAARLSVTPDEVATLAARLARLNHRLTGPERAELAVLGGQPLTGIMRELVEAVAPEQLETARAAGPDAVRGLMATAVRPLAVRPELRDRLLELHRAAHR